MEQRTLTTPELVSALARRGLRTSAGALRLDVHRGLISSSMPGIRGVPRRGVPARWSPPSVRRAVYLARLRARGVNGHVLPLLAYVRDGWGWEEILPTLRRAAQKAWSIDRPSLNRPSRVRTVQDVLDNADTGETGSSSLDYKSELRPARQYLASAVWTGVPAPETTMIPAVLAISRELPPSPAGRASDEETIRTLGAAIEEGRRRLGISSAEIAEWLSQVDRDTVQRGHALLRAQVTGFRRIAAATTPGRANSNLLTMFGTDPDALAADLRRQTGRPTAADMLAQFIIHCVFLAAVLPEDVVLEQHTMRQSTSRDGELSEAVGAA